MGAMDQFRVYVMEDGRRLLMEDHIRYPVYDFFFGFAVWRATLQ